MQQPMMMYRNEMNELPQPRFYQVVQMDRPPQPANVQSQQRQQVLHQQYAQPPVKTVYPQSTTSDFRVKVINKKDIRIWRHPQLLDVLALYRFIATQWEEDGLIAQYEDDDNDMITIASSVDLQEAFESAKLKNQDTLRIFVQHSPKNYLTDFHEQVQELGNMVFSLMNTWISNPEGTHSMVNPPGEQSQNQAPDLNPRTQSGSIPNEQVPVPMASMTQREVFKCDSPKTPQPTQIANLPETSLPSHPGAPATAPRDMMRMLSPVAECEESQGASVGKDWGVLDRERTLSGEDFNKMNNGQSDAAQHFFSMNNGNNTTINWIKPEMQNVY